VVATVRGDVRNAPVLNLADLGSLLIIVTNPALCCIAATQSHESWSALGLCLGVGLVVGAFGAVCSSKLSYRILAIESGGRDGLDAVLFLVYLLTPMAFLAGSLWTSDLLAEWVVRSV
jgi:hypothetical protein